MSGTRDDASSDEIAALACEQARDHAERGDLQAAADAFQRALDAGRTDHRARAALGLAAVREGLGDQDGARLADRVAVDSGDPEYAPRAAYHLAVSYEKEGLREDAAEAWRAVVDFGNDAYVPAGLMSLARHADEAGDFERARPLWEEAAGAQPPYGPAAALELGTRLVERGEAAAAGEVLERAVRGGADVGTLGQLWTALGIAHLERAVEAFREGIRAGDTDTLPLALELLARTLPLRGQYAEADDTWQGGLHHDDPEVASAVRSRLRREFGPDAAGDDVPRAWWDDLTESAVTAGTLPALTDEAFSALDRVYACAAVHHAQGGADLPDDVYEDLGDAVRVPADFAWGGRLRASVEEWLRDAGADAQRPSAASPGHE